MLKKTFGNLVVHNEYLLTSCPGNLYLKNLNLFLRDINKLTYRY